MHLRDGTANGYMSCLDNCLNKRKLSWNNAVGMATDGASVMRGCRNGLSALVSRKVPGIVTVHCVAHLLQLAILDAASGITYLTHTFEPALKKLFSFYHYSAKHLTNLENVADVIETALKHLGPVHKVRWVASKTRAISAIIVDWKAVVLHWKKFPYKEELLRRRLQREVW